MNTPDLLQLIAQGGSLALFVGYIMWRDVRNDKLSKERIEADKALATSLVLLTETIKARIG